MSNPAVIFAKLAGIQKAMDRLLDDEYSRKGQRPLGAFRGDDITAHFKRATYLLEELRQTLPDLYGDFPALPDSPDNSHGEGWFSREQLETLARELDHIFEIRANSELLAPGAEVLEPKRTVFISHGKAPDWREVQSFLERDVGLKTLELEQEPSGGMTVSAKLDSVSQSCDSAVIVMTGDDQGPDGTLRARENVMHEIGFFHGRLGPSKVCLLHEEGVNIPSNLAGIVYVPFPKGMIKATFGVLQRELNAIYRVRS